MVETCEKSLVGKTALSHISSPGDLTAVLAWKGELECVSRSSLADFLRRKKVIFLAAAVMPCGLLPVQAVVFTDLPLAQALAFDAFCHAHNPPVAFIRAETRGVFGSVFCDFGPGFTVSDVDGEEPFSGILASVANSGPEALVTCVDDERLQFQDGDSVIFSEVSARVSFPRHHYGLVRDLGSVVYLGCSSLCKWVGRGKAHGAIVVHLSILSS